MRTTVLIVLALAVGAGAGLQPLEAQRADRKAVEAVLDALPPGERTLYISPLFGQTEIRGNALILEEDRKRLEERYGAILERPEKVIRCEHPFEPETCTMPEGSILYQFLMPDPIGRDQILALRVVRLMSEEGSGGKIHREDWILALAQLPDVGWDVIRKQLEGESDQPWPAREGGRSGGGGGEGG